MQTAKIIAFLLVLSFFWSCKKESPSLIPMISFSEQSKYVVADSGKGETPVLFSFGFADGDSDIGPIQGKKDITPTQNIVFIDNRDSTQQYLFNFPEIPNSVVQRDGVSGTFDVTFPAQFLIARDDTTVHKLTDTVQFRVYVFDKLFNKSNVVLTDSIVIVK